MEIIKLHKLVLLFVIISLWTIECKKKSKPVEIRFISASTICNPELFEYCDMGITPGSKNRSFDMNANLLVDIVKDLNIGLLLFMRSKKETEYTEFFAYGFNVCRVMEGFMGQTVARLWQANLKKFSNIPISCPIQKGEYYVKKMKIDRKSIPMVAMDGIYMAKSHIYYKKGSSEITIANSTLEVEIHI